MLTKTVEIIVVGKREKVFEDGGKGYWVDAVDSAGKMMNFWVPGENGEVLEVHDVEKWDASLAITVVLRRRVWNGQEKLALVELK